MDEAKQTVAGLFGRAAAGYDRVAFFHRVAHGLLARAGIHPGMRVLDAACGSGAVLAQAARLVGSAGLAVGIDLAQPMAAVAARRLQQQGQDRAGVAVMDAHGWGCGPPGSLWSAARRQSTCWATRRRRCAAGGRSWSGRDAGDLGLRRPGRALGLEGGAAGAAGRGLCRCAGVVGRAMGAW
jgi:SAM-dependent methyltransferase